MSTVNPSAAVRKQYLTPGFHSDVVWLEDQRDYAAVLMGCTRQYLDACRADDTYGVFLHELTYLKPYIDSNPGEAEYIRELIAAGRVGTGGAHSLPSETIISGEAIIRNFIQGRRYHEAVLGDRPWVLMLWDVFGHVSQISQIAAGCGFRAIIWSKDIRGARPLFYHEALDGTRILVRRMPYGFGDRGMERDIEFLRACLHEPASLGYPADLRLDCNDFRPPRGWVVGRTRWLRSLDPPIIVSGQAHRLYFGDIMQAERRGEIFIPVMARDFEWHHQGTGVAHIDLKIANRLCENTIVNAEKWATIGSQFGALYPWEALDKAWRQVFFAQHHDAITGPCCDRSYFDLMAGYREALSLSHEVLSRALAYLAAGVNTTGSDALAALVVFNPLNWARTDLAEAQITFRRPVRSFRLVSAASGEPLPFEVVDATGPSGRIRHARVRFLVTVPSLGYTTVHVVRSDDPLPLVEKLAPSDTVDLENEFYRLTVSAAAGGGIVSLYDKELGRELINSQRGPANELISIEEDIADHPEPPWEVMTKVSGRRYHSRDYNAKLEALRGPVTQRVRISGPFKDCQRVQEIVLIRGLRRIEFITDIQRYRGKEHLHVVAFPVNVAGGVPVFDDRSGCLVKRKSRGYMDFRTWQWRNYSDCGARHLYQWIDLSRSVTLRFGRTGAINVGSTSVVIRNDRPLEEISYQLQSALIGKGVPCTIFYDDCERDRRRNLPHEDSLLPRETPNEDLPWGTSFRFILDVGEANEYLRALFEELPPDLVAEMRAERRARGISSRLVMEEDIRIDMWEQPTPYPWPPLPTVIITAETIDDLRAAVSHLASQIEEKSVADLPEEVNAVGDLPWDDHGVAVLNRGTPLCSVENDDTIVLFLMHSVRWSRAHLDFRPVAEHKTHRFEYALYPHAGAWRDAGVPRAAYEYNNRLSVVQAEPSAGPLPAEFSFLDCHGPAILTALKPAGYPLAGLDPVPEGRPAEIALRFYEPLGFPAELELSWFSGIEQVHLADMLERPERELRAKDGRLRRKLPRFRIETLRMRVPAPDASLGETELGRRIEPGQPVYFAHWEHNAGAAPLGYSPIGVSLKGDILTDTHVPQGGWTVNRLTLGLVNSLSVPVSGKVTFDLPEGWRMEPPEVAYELPARGSAQYPVTLIFETSLRRGAVKARIEYGGQVYEAVREVGEPARVEWTLRPCKRYGAAVELRTDYPQDVTVDAWVIVPHELWGSLAETAQLCEVPESYERLVVPAGGRLRWNIHVPKDAPDAWLTVKLAYHGRVEYRQIQIGARTR